MKIFGLGVYGLKILETDLEICFVEQILDAVMKLVPIRFLSILKMQYIIGKVLGITKPCTQLHPPPPSLFQPPPSSFQPPPSSFQPPPSSLQHPQQYLNQDIALNWAIPKFRPKIKSCPF